MEIMDKLVCSGFLWVYNDSDEQSHSENSEKQGIQCRSVEAKGNRFINNMQRFNCHKSQWWTLTDVFAPRGGQTL